MIEPICKSYIEEKLKLSEIKDVQALLTDLPNKRQKLSETEEQVKNSCLSKIAEKVVPQDL